MSYELFEVVFALCMIGILVWLGIAAVLVNRKRSLSLAKAEAVGPLFRVNEIGDVWAVCAEDDFSSAYEKYCRNVKKGKKAISGGGLKVSPTFTFWKESEAHTRMHTGSAKVGNDLLVSFVEQFLGITEEEGSLMTCDYPSLWGKMMSILVVDDRRLFVPFAGRMPDLSEQDKFYGKKSMDDFRKFLEDVLKKKKV